MAELSTMNRGSTLQLVREVTGEDVIVQLLAGVEQITIDRAQPLAEGAQPRRALFHVCCGNTRQLVVEAVIAPACRQERLRLHANLPFVGKELLELVSCRGRFSHLAPHLSGSIDLLSKLGSTVARILNHTPSRRELLADERKARWTHLCAAHANHLLRQLDQLYELWHGIQA